MVAVVCEVAVICVMVQGWVEDSVPRKSISMEALLLVSADLAVVDWAVVVSDWEVMDSVVAVLAVMGWAAVEMDSVGVGSVVMGLVVVDSVMMGLVVVDSVVMGLVMKWEVVD